MSDMMVFPASVEEFMEQYKMTDTDHVYSNGTEYVPIYRMRQWFEHCRNQQRPVRHGRWKEMHYEGGILDGTNFDRCSVCGYERVFNDPALKTVFKYCPNCGAKMDGGAD